MSIVRKLESEPLQAQPVLTCSTPLCARPAVARFKHLAACEVHEPELSRRIAQGDEPGFENMGPPVGRHDGKLHWRKPERPLFNDSIEKWLAMSQRTLALAEFEKHRPIVEKLVRWKAREKKLVLPKRWRNRNGGTRKTRNIHCKTRGRLPVWYNWDTIFQWKETELLQLAYAELWRVCLSRIVSGQATDIDSHFVVRKAWRQYWFFHCSTKKRKGGDAMRFAVLESDIEARGAASSSNRELDGAIGWVLDGISQPNSNRKRIGSNEFTKDEYRPPRRQSCFSRWADQWEGIVEDRGAWEIGGTSRRRLDPAIHAQWRRRMQRMYRNGVSLADAAKRLGCTPRAVLLCLSEDGDIAAASYAASIFVEGFKGADGRYHRGFRRWVVDPEVKRLPHLANKIRRREKKHQKRFQSRRLVGISN